MNVVRIKYWPACLYLLLVTTIFVLEKDPKHYSRLLTMPWSRLIMADELLHPGDEITTPQQRAKSDIFVPALINTAILMMLSYGVSRIAAAGQEHRGNASKH